MYYIHKETPKFHWFRLQLHFSQTVCSISSHSSGVIFRLSNAINFKRIHCPNLQFNFRSKEHEIFSLYVHRSWPGSFLDLVSFQIAAFSIPSVCVCVCVICYTIFFVWILHKPVSCDMETPNGRVKQKKWECWYFFRIRLFLPSFSLHTKRKQAMYVGSNNKKIISKITWEKQSKINGCGSVCAMRTKHTSTKKNRKKWCAFCPADYLLLSFGSFLCRLLVCEFFS